MPSPCLRPLAVVLTVAALLAPRTFAQPLDPAFNPGASADVFALAAQPDGKILLGGNFTTVAGTARARIARLNVDGSIDPTFNPGASSSVTALAVQPDGRILVAGSFTTLGGVARTRLGRLHADGTVDTTFSALADATVLALHLQPDGRILIGGIFTTINSTPRASFARLHADGALDSTFAPVIATTSSQLRADAFAVQPDGKILVGGTFSIVNGTPYRGLVRLHSNGSIDPTFTPSTSLNQVFALALQPDGMILVGGTFSSISGAPRANLARLTPYGVPDNQVGVIGPNGTVRAIALQPDGTFLIGGTFSAIGNTTQSYLARYHADGSLDSTFAHSASGSNGSSTSAVYRIVSPGPRQFVLAGTFSTVSGQPRQGIARIGAPPPGIITPPRDESFATGQPIVLSVTATGSNLTYQWLRNGAAIAGATDASLSLPAATAAHAGAYSVVVSNAFGTTTSTTANISIDPRTVYIAQPPASRTVAAGATLTLTFVGGGQAPIAYQWFKDGAPIAGAASAALPLGWALPEHSGSYTVSITDPSGTLTSTAASITVTGPVPYLVSTLTGRLGQSGSADGPVDSARIASPHQLATDAAGNIYLAARDAHVIRKISPSGTVITLAGQSGARGFADGAGATARFDLPTGIVVDSAGNIFVADSGNHRIRKITPPGVVSTFAGSVAGALEGVGTAAQLSEPTGLALDRAGNLFVTETSKHTVRKITPAGHVTLLAGLSEIPGHVDGFGTAVRFSRPSGIVVDSAGNLYVADTGNHVIRHIAASGQVSTFAGQPGASEVRDGPLSSARFSSPQHLALDPAGNLFVISSYTVRRISPAGEVTTPIGAANAPEFLDGIGTSARFSLLTGIAADALGTLYLSDSTNALVRQATLLGRRGSRLANLSVRTVAGTGDDTLIAGFNLAGGPKSLLVRAIGPTLATFGVDGVLSDPTLQLETNGATLAQNNDWHASAGTTADTLATASSRVGAFALPAQSRDAALLQSLAAGSYTAQVGGGNGIALVEVYDASSEPKTQSPELKTESRLANVSARTRAGTGDAALIVGFVVTGDSPRTVLLRAIGPTLTTFGVDGALATPRLELTRDALTVASNTGWSGASALAQAFTQVGAFALPTDSRDAALLVTLLPGAYTAQVTPASGDPGIALVEIYDVP